MSNCTEEGLNTKYVVAWLTGLSSSRIRLLYGLMLARWPGGFSIFCDEDEDDDDDEHGGYGTHTEG